MGWACGDRFAGVRAVVVIMVVIVLVIVVTVIIIMMMVWGVVAASDNGGVDEGVMELLVSCLPTRLQCCGRVGRGTAPESRGEGDRAPRGPKPNLLWGASV